MKSSHEKALGNVIKGKKKNPHMDFNSPEHKRAVAKGKAEEKHGYYGPNPNR